MLRIAKGLCFWIELIGDRMKTSFKKWIVKAVGLVCILLLMEILKIDKINFMVGLLSLIYLDMAKEDW